MTTSRGARFCTSCGAVLDPDPGVVLAAAQATSRTAPTCAACDRVLDDDARYCPRCGASRRGDRLVPAGARAAQRSAGWFADPFARHAYRWWDGEQWTAYASDREVHWDPVTFTDPAPPGVRGVGVAVVGFAVGVVLSFAATLTLRALNEPGGRAVTLVVSALTLWLGLGGAILWITATRGTRSLATDYGLRFRWMDIPLGVAGLIGGRLLGAIMVLPIVALWPHLKLEGKGIYGSHEPTTVQWIVLVLVVCVGAPFIEELFFRGVVQTRLVGRYGEIVGILLTAVLFGAAHLIGWVGPITIVFVVAIIGAGVVFGILRAFTGRLGPSMVAHMLFNVQAIVVFALTR